MKTEPKGKSTSHRSIKIEETGGELKISVRSNFYLNPDLKKRYDRFDFITLGILVMMMLGFGALGMGFMVHFFRSPQSLLLWIVIAFFFIVALSAAQAALPHTFFFKLRSHSQRVSISSHAIRRDQPDDRELLVMAPFKGIYLRARSQHKRFPFSVMMVDGHGNRKVVLKDLSHEQAVYIARVIHRYLKLDAPEGDFIEPDEDFPALEEVAPAKKKA